MQAITTVPALKYRIKAMLSALPEESRVDIRKSVMKSCGISANTYSRYINLRDTNPQDIPATVLKEFADALGVSMDHLFNN